MKRNILWKTAGITLAFSMMCSSLVMAAPAQTEPEETPGMELVNKTERDLSFLAVKDVKTINDEEQLAPADEDNLLQEEELKSEESREISLAPEESSEDKEDAPAEEDTGDNTPLQLLEDILDLNELTSSRLITFLWEEDEDTQLQLLVVPEDTVYAEIWMEEDVPFLKYRTAEDKEEEELKSTLDVQAAIAEIASAEPPADGERTVVSQVAFPNCDDPSHGYYEITYSDGSVEYEEY